jgi:large subunit ribosomal protein L10
MPNAKVLSEKQAIVAALTDKLNGAAAGVLVDYSGISVADDTAMRKKMREENVDYSVVKNTLLRFAANNANLNELDPLLNGTTSLAISADDPVAPARVVKEYADKLQNCFEIKGGFMDGRVISVDEINALAAIPPLPILRAQALGTMLAPITSLAIVLNAIAQKNGEPATEAEAAPEAAD